MKYLIVNTEAFSKGNIPQEVIDFCKKRQNCNVILDEASYIKCNTPMAERKKSKRNQAIRTLLHCLSGMKIALTGTPMSKSPVNLYDIMDALRKNYFPETMFQFAEKYTIRFTIPRTRIRTTINEVTYKQIYNRLHSAAKNGRDYLTATASSVMKFYTMSYDALKHIYYNKEYSPFMNIEHLMSRIENDSMFVKKTDVMDLPCKTYEVRTVELSPAMKKIYNELCKEKMIDGLVVENGLELYTRLQDVCNGYIPQDTPEGKTAYIKGDNAKIDTLLDVLEELNGEKVIVFCNRTLLLEDTIEILKQEGYKVARYDGKISDKEKEDARDKWCSNDVTVMVANQASAGFGIDWLKDAHYCVFIANDCSVERRLQAEDRIHRGGIDNVSRTYIDIIAEGTVEDKVLRAQKLGKELVGMGKTDAKIFELED